MSPDRKRTLSSCSSKPYSRPTTPDTPSNMQSADIAQHESAQTTVITSKPGFPTHAQYKQIEASYLATLIPKRRDKALISQSLFDRIWAVLHTPDENTETAQFRFWVRKKFTFGTIKKAVSAASEETSSESDESGQTVLLHEKNLVAVQDQIYDILCYSHGTAGHAGRDKTCLSIRQHYTWIPKDLVARFIKACPTCIAKKCGISNAADENATKNILPTLRQYLRNVSAEEDKGEERDEGAEGSRIYASASASNPRPDTPFCQFESSAKPTPMAAVENRLDRVANHSAPVQSNILQSLPMSREVSLYQGLPNGWQYLHNDFTAAHDDFVLRKATWDVSGSGAHIERPRIPSIAPIMRTYDVPLAADSEALPPLQSDDIDAEFGSPPSSLLPPTLRALKTGPQNHHTPQIDPALSYPAAGDSSCACNVKTQPVPPASIIRAAAPPSINLESLNSQKTIQAFLALRNTSSLTPDSPPPALPLASPAASDTPQLSVPPLSVDRSVSPTDTELLTPVDGSGRTGLSLSLGPSGDAVAKELAEKASSLMLNITADAACDSGVGLLVV